MAAVFLPQNILVNKCNRVNEAENEMPHMLTLHKFEPKRRKVEEKLATVVFFL